LASSFLRLECVVHVRYYSELLRFFVHAIKDVHEAQDLVQQTFERVLERRYAGDQVANARALLFEVARNLLIDRHRQAQIRRHESDEVLRDHSGPAAAEPEAVYAGNQRVVLLVAAIEALPPRCRKAFVLHKIDGLSHAEVAREMGVTLNMVERHVMLAVAACRKALADVPSPQSVRLLQPASGDPASD
jgi:RNA polymerase sigma factor (sigma-70 family)